MESDTSNAVTDVLWSAWPDAAPLQVIDVGANPIEGDAPYRGLLDAGYAHVTGFEPQPEALASLNARRSEAERYHGTALGDGTCATMHLFAHSGFASVYPVDPAIARLVGFERATRPAGTVPVMTARLDDVPGVPQADYLKIDVQGAELSIIAHGRERLAQAVLVQTEVRFLTLYDREPGFGALDAELRGQGFRFHDFAFLKRVSLRSASHGRLRPRMNRQVIDGDAFYVRDLSRPEAMTDAQLFRLAILAEAVVRSPNLVLFCLDSLVVRGAILAKTVDAFIARLPPAALRHPKGTAVGR